MSDNDKDANNQGSDTLKIGGAAKLSLSKNVDTKLRQNLSQGRSKTVTVEVRKTRSTQRVEGGPTTSRVVEVSRAGGALQRMREDNRARPAGDDSEARSLTKNEMELRRMVLERAQGNKENEAQAREEERRQREEIARKRPELTPDEVEVAVIQENEESRKERDKVEKEKAKKRKADLDDDFEDEGSAAKKAAAKKRRRDDFGEEDFDFDPEDLRNDSGDELILPRHLLEDSDEFEDYSEDVEPVEDDTVVAVVAPREDDEAKKRVVRPIQSSERIVMAAVDPRKLMKNLRSEAPVMAKPRPRRLESTASALVTAAAPDTPSTRKASSPRRKGFKRAPEPSNIVREVVIPETIVVTDLANRMAVRAVDVIKSLMKMGMMVTQSQAIDADTAELIVAEFGHTPKRVTESDLENELFEKAIEDAAESLMPRAPVVTVMGHVDHGKTSLLDAIRATDVVSRESGGITQHIGAYQVRLESGQKISFIDTPGHEAFTAMRARGARVTDVVVLVVAADDGVKQQTVEALNHAKAAGVPMIVAVNKIDKQGADPQKVRTELMQYEIVTEEFGGEVMAVDVSAKTRQGLDKLLETILLQAEILELKANPETEASGVVIESRVDKGRGVVATLLVQRGTLKVGDVVVSGTSFGHVRALLNEHGQNLKDAGPATPVEVLGFDEAPPAGELFAVAEHEKQARDIVNLRLDRQRQQKNLPQRLTLEELFQDGKAKVKELPIIVKGDVHGSVEAIIGSLDKIDASEVKARVIHSGVGAVNESDVALAQASNAVIVAFNVRANSQAKDLASREKIDIKYYSIIYDLVDAIKSALSGMLAPSFKEITLGNASIRQVFSVTKAGKVAGCMVTQGLIKRGARVRLLRDNVVIHEGSLKTLKRFKDDVKEVREGFECGMAFENYDDMREGDVIEAFELEQVERSVA